MEALSKSDETKQELKPWQKGFELDYLKDLEKPKKSTVSRRTNQIFYRKI